MTGTSYYKEEKRVYTPVRPLTDPQEDKKDREIRTAYSVAITEAQARLAAMPEYIRRPVDCPQNRARGKVEDTIAAFKVEMKEASTFWVLQAGRRTLPSSIHDDFMYVDVDCWQIHMKLRKELKRIEQAYLSPFPK